MAHLKGWVNKMLGHASVDSLEGHYRRTWLQMELLELYFQIRGLWFLGHKKSFMYFRDHDPKAMELFSHIYKNPTDRKALAALAKYVIAAGG